MADFSSSTESEAIIVHGFPKQLHTSVLVKEGTVHTDIVVTNYQDRIFVVITQINKFGTLISAESETKADGGKLYQLSTLMGKRDDPLLSIYARQIIERIAQKSEKPLLLSISLQDESRDPESLQTILNHLYEHSQWG